VIRIGIKLTLGSTRSKGYSVGRPKLHLDECMPQAHSLVHSAIKQVPRLPWTHA
jgi:hypothetical protein